MNTLPESMRAATYRKYGPPDVLAVEQVAVPESGDNDVLVRIHASTVNRTDCGFLRAKPFIVRLFSGLSRPRSNILGCEFAGEVVHCGRLVTDFVLGDRVFGFKDDDFGFGGHAEYTTMPASAMIAKIPDQFSYLQAAPALEGAHYALHYIRATGINSDQTVLINGATGAIGSAAVQIIKHLGAQVTAVCDGRHQEQIAELGADFVIDYHRQDFTSHDQKFDVIFDAVGKSTFGKCRHLLTENGFYASTELGPYAQNPLLALRSRFFGRKKVVFPLPGNSKEDAQYIRKLMTENHYRPLIDTTYSLAEIKEAYRYVETGMKVGNVVINTK